MAVPFLPLGPVGPDPAGVALVADSAAAGKARATTYGADRAPRGRNEQGVWWRRHDEYGKH
jgi:predicted dithiol-disulfide oxidoreductase (DUF899 family)